MPLEFFSVFFFFFFQAAVADTLSRKKLSRKLHIALATCIVGPHKYKLAPIVQSCANRVMVVKCICARGHAYSRSAWA